MKRFIWIIIAVLLITPAAGQAGMGLMSKKNTPAISGKAVEVLAADGSTYVCVEKNGQKTWVVVPEMKVAVGDEVSFASGKEVPDYVSQPFNRKFEKIIFSTGPAAPQMSADEALQQVAIAGKAVEVLAAGGYTYVCVEKDGKKTWVAVPAMDVFVGERVSFQPGTVMPAFESKSLKRTFEKIIFSGGPAPLETPADPAPMKVPVTGKAAEVLNSGGYTYVSVENNGKRMWVAVPAMKVAVGDTVSFVAGDEMAGLENRSLNRKFEKIIFSSGPAASLQDTAETKQRVAVSGKAVEVLNSGGYTYVSVEKDAKLTWVAVPQVKVNAGEEISFQPGDEMASFPSKTLNRTFEKIIFSPGPVTAQNGKGKKTPEKSPGSKGKEAAAAGSDKVAKAVGPNAYTISEIYKLKGKLDKKKVTVRGKVVKVAVGIMKRNWIHLQDGTGSKKKKTNDLVVTSDAQAEEGDVITISGALAKDKDFGSGYKFEVIVEKAELVGE